MTCPLCEAIKNEPEKMWVAPAWEGDVDFEIFKTKASKGHRFRYMIVSRMHTLTIGEQSWRYAAGRLIEFMLDACDEDFAVMYPDHATIKDHFHLVATDLLASAKDVAQIMDTKRFEIRFKKAGELVQ